MPSNNRLPTAEDDVGSFIARAQGLPEIKPGEKRGRLIFAMDATMSRQPSWDRALQIQAEMFHETALIGGLDVQLVYFRGFHECKASKWVGNPDALAQLMTRIDCRGGNTQIGRVLTHVRQEARAAKVDAVVYVGDAMEENLDALCTTAGEIGLMSVPLFMFQEGTDATAAKGYRELARLTRGVYLQLDKGSAHSLRELLQAVAVYATGGLKALANRSRSERGALLLLEQLS